MHNREIQRRNIGEMRNMIQHTEQTGSEGAIPVRKYEAVMFDLDGTLLNTLEDLTDSVNVALASVGCAARSIEEVRHFVGNGVRRLMERALPGGADDPRFPAAFAAFGRDYAVHCNRKTRAYPGIPELLRALRAAGVRTAVVSNKTESAVRRLCGVYFDGLVEIAVGDVAGRARKPAPDAVLAALDALSLPAARAVYVGDSEVDVETARRAGLPCISVLWGFRDADCLRAAGASQMVRDAEQLRKCLLG